MSVSLTFTGAQILGQTGLAPGALSIDDGLLQDAPAAREVDLTGYWIFPGIVDVHGDAFERHVAPRRGAMKDIIQGLWAAEAELAVQGVTTATLAQFISWEGGLRGADFAEKLFPALRDLKADMVTDVRPQLRFETHLLEDYDTLPQRVTEWEIPYVVLNDHLPHDRLAEGRKPPRLTGKALGAGINPETYFAHLLELHGRGAAVKEALPGLCQALLERGVRLGSHDDQSPDDRAWWRVLGVQISEFPETVEAAQSAKDAGDAVILGAPNVVRGGSHKGNVSALDLISMGLCDALASDYHYPSLRRAAFFVADAGIMDLAGAWHLISGGPANVLGLTDRGSLTVGNRADLVILDPKTRRIGATMSAGVFSHLSGPVATRFVS